MRIFDYFNVNFVREFTFTLNCSKAVFMSALKAKVNSPEFEFFEGLRDGPPFKGVVAGDHFQMRRRMSAQNLAREVKINGAVVEKDDQCVVTVEVDAFVGLIAYYSMIITIFSLMVIAVGLFVSEFAILTRLSCVAAGTMMIMTLSLFARRRLGDYESDLEKELVFIVSAYKPSLS